jgi:LysM repeat protein
VNNINNITSAGVFISILFIFFSQIFFYGFTSQINGADFSAFDLINEVNNVRSSRGLQVLQINSILMNVAQSHSDYQASIHRSSHAGRSGEIVNDRVTAAGYGSGEKIVAGENVASLDTGVTNMLPIIVYEIWSDSGHLGAMINPKYQDIGVGIATDEKIVYVTLNLGGIFSGNLGQKTTPASIQGPLTLQPADASSNPLILPLFTSTPMENGTVHHTVGYGQTLSTISRIYQVDIKEIIRLNQIDPDRIYSGQILLIRTGIPILPTGTPTATLLPPVPPTFTATPNPSGTPTEISKLESEPVDTRQIGVISIFILFAVMIVLILLSIQQKRPSG